jgi:pimeloyl-[acyl-carrier protein] methyl ester esterase
MNLVLLPGMDGTGELFRPFLASANGTAACSVVRYAGNEVLKWSDYLGLIRQLLPSTSDYILVAESFSGAFAIELASRHELPVGLRGIVLCSTFANCPVPPALLPVALTLGRVVMRCPIPRWAIRMFLLEQESNDSLVNLVRESLKAVDGRVLSSRLEMLLRCDVRQQAGALKVPCVAIVPKRDRLVSRDAQRSLAQAIGDQHVTRIDGPHLIMQTRPAEVWRVINEFASKIC